MASKDTAKEATENATLAKRDERDPVLRALFCASTGLSLFQVGWFNMDFTLLPRLALGLVPTSALAQVEATTGKRFVKRMGLSPGGSQFFARGFFTKYHNQFFVGATHILVSPAWMLIIPLQLHPEFRRCHKPLHRALGGAFFAMSTSLMLGFAAIMKKKLNLNEHAPYAKGLEGMQRRAIPATLRFLGDAGDAFLVASASWFCYTLVRAWLAAVRRRFAEHEEWVLRHIASGQWVALMRLLLAAGMMPLSIRRYGDTKQIQSAVFAATGMLGWAMCLAGAELGISRIRARKAKAKAVKDSS